MNVKDIRRLFDYTDYANRLALDAAEKLTEEQRRYDFKISHGSIHGTLTHMAGAEWVWLERWGGVSPTELWTDDKFADLQAIRNRWNEIEENRRKYLAGVNNEDILRDLSFRRLNGDQYTMPLGEQMQHVVNHATLHRGQVVGMIRQLGITPPATDLLFYLRT